jgi:hypothetical protein
MFRPVCAGFAVLFTISAFGQAPAAQKFEVATIKLTDPNFGGILIRPGCAQRQDSDREGSRFGQSGNQSTCNTRHTISSRIDEQDVHLDRNAAADRIGQAEL